MIKINPFSEYAITDFDQYKRVPFLEIKGVQMIKKTIEGRIRDNFYFPERLILLGQRGIGKTSTLFFIKEILDKSGTPNFMFSRLIDGAEHFRLMTEESLENVTKKPFFILVDFPDNVETRNFKDFLNFVWSLFIHKNNKNINLIFALNKSHYEDSLTFSETLGKFHRIYLDNLNKEETIKLINARLKIGGDGEFFDEDTKNLIYEYSKGIPRNIISASKDLTDSYIDKKQVTKKMAEYILKKDYIKNILNDRIENFEEREIYLDIISIIENTFNGKVSPQNLLADEVKKVLDIGRNKTFHYLSELHKFGILTIVRGGASRNKKIILLK